MSGRFLDTGEAILGAVLGDYLEAKGSALARPMGFFYRGAPLLALPKNSARLCVLVHGLACTEHLWTYPDEPETDYGALLERDLGLGLDALVTLAPVVVDGVLLQAVHEAHERVEHVPEVRADGAARDRRRRIASAKTRLMTRFSFGLGPLCCGPGLSGLFERLNRKPAPKRLS